MNGVFFFIVLPYLATLSLLLGSIYRYRFSGYQVSSLSSQFLESKQLYFGSRPFHWGLIFLFFGHLAAFLTPRAVLAWNQVPLRLYILEFTAFAFGFIVLAGLILLILRRIKTKRLRVVTTWMDIFVYIILLTQVVTGLWTAFFFRWGSSWFALVLTPYLRSVFKLNPEIAAVSQLPVAVQIHIISAFILIGMIPFTRFMHFLVYPFTYLWRPYQQVIWNYRNTKN
ncbi:respiratory nitrate reductase subunit gamma [Mariniphaga sediminis]|jgi:nitrate reductase gamma subunit|uniref:Respiratory nitrate reductase subunit gamma n=1 Tax=Mariniphaga sediminis TaxID=1628158 RepID=A0A399D5M0_9BACT|nr:respiratory nitrate reductase subunit gamma [Mariniphaga sediminis]RIH64219.1 respiratory nitrate reductase subunit gamma [Mariniphaga sediminis]RIH66498.1 respiratory nitrate reductase subunit gamma [Mariniphaga sediminis]